MTDYSYSLNAGETRLVIHPAADEPPMIFLLQEPDYNGGQTDRISLRDKLRTEETAQAVIRAATNREGNLLPERSNFPVFSVKVNNPDCPNRPGKMVVWAQPLTA